MSNKKLMVIGLDGATWDLMRPFAEKGILPTFKKLMENGVYGNLESTIPPITIPAWISFATGKNPGKIGCYDFLIPRNSLNDLRPITTKDIHGKTFYEILDENGKKCIIINLPGSHPPRIKEIVITSLMTQGDNFIFPPELVNEIPELKKYKIIPNNLLPKNGMSKDFIDDIREMEKIRFECARKLFRKDWDFFFLMFNGTDMIQHAMYNKLISGTMDDNSDPIKVYKEIDKYIGWFVGNVFQDVNILFMSDHGFRVYKKGFITNGWLKEEGYLKVEPTLKLQNPIFFKSDEKAKIKKIKLYILNYLRVLTWLHPFYIKLMEILPLGIHAGVQPKLSETIACSSTISVSNFGWIYINDKKRFIDGKVEIADYENVRTEIINKLKQLRDPETGEKVIKNIWEKEDIYSGSQLGIAPDIIFMLVDEYRSNSSFSALTITKIFDDKIGRKIDEYTIGINEHALQGIFLAYGPDIRKGVEIQNSKIYDLAPTILHLMNVPIPKDMDGRVLKEILKEDSELAKRKIKYQEVEEKEIMKEKIRELRYLGRI